MAQTRANGKATKSDFSDLSDQIATIKKDIADLTTLMGETAAGKASEAQAKGAEMAGMARDRVRDTANRGKAAAEQAYARSEDAVRQKPALAIGVAAAIGFVAGYMATGRARH